MLTHASLHSSKVYESLRISFKNQIDGTLEIPNIVLNDLPAERVVKVILLVEEPLIEEGFSAESFRESWQQATTGQTLPLSEIWEGMDVD